MEEIISLHSLGDINSSPIEISAVGPGASISSSAFFSASDTEHGTELWRYNGGSATLWKDVRPGPESSHPTQFTSVGSYVVYVADNGVHGPELYTTANINATGLLGDVQPGHTHAAPVILGASNGYLWFTTESTSTDPSLRFSTELWVTNAISPPQKLHTFAEGSISQVTVHPLQPTLFFLARHFGAPSGYIGLYRANQSGSAQLIDWLRMNQAVPIPTSPVYAVASGFVCYQFIEQNKEPRIYQISSGSKGALLDIDGSGFESQPTHFVSNGTDRICFAASTTSEGRELWTTNGTAGTTTLLADVVPGSGSSNPSSLIMARGHPGVFFQAENGTLRDLYFANAEASPVLKFCVSAVQNSSQPTMASGTDLAYINQVSGGFQLCLADGKPDGTTIQFSTTFTSVERLWNGSTTTPLPSLGTSVHLLGTRFGSSELHRLASRNNLFPIALRDDAHPRNFFTFGSSEQLFIVDTSTQPMLYRFANTTLVTPVILNTPPDSLGGNASSLAADFTEVAGILFFTAHNGHDRRLFISPTGQQDSAQSLAGIYDPEQLVPFQGRLFLLGRSSPTGTGSKQLFQVEIDNGNAYASLVHGSYKATALMAAAGRLFFVEQHNSTIERLNSLDSSLVVTTVSAFYKDPSGIGITQPTASSNHLYFTAPFDNSPTAKRVIWGTDGTSFSNLGPSLYSPRLMGALGDECLFWFAPDTGGSYVIYRWDADSGPVSFYNGSGYFDPPEGHRVSGQPAGIELAGWFYFTSRSGRLQRMNGATVEELFSDPNYIVRPESLAILSGKVVFVASQDDFDCLFFSYSPGSMPTMFWSPPHPTMPCPLFAIGSKLYFTTCEIQSNIGVTKLFRTDGTSTGTEFVTELTQRKIASVPMGAYRGHLMLSSFRTSGGSSMEPALLNAVPSIPQPLALQGMRSQPVPFTYSDLITGPATDADGDSLTPVRLFNLYGSLTRNGTPVSISTDIAPGDTYEWTPPPGDSGALFPFYLYCSDDWEEGATYGLIDMKTPYDVWRTAQFPVIEGEPDPPANSAPEEDFNGNGISNVFEQFSGRDPRAPNSTPGWVPSVVGGGAVFRYTFIRTATLPQGYALAVECSPDMTPLSWDSMATKTENAAWTGDATVTETTLPDGRVLVEVDAPMSGNCRFFRLQATY